MHTFKTFAPDVCNLIWPSIGFNDVALRTFLTQSFSLAEAEILDAFNRSYKWHLLIFSLAQMVCNWKQEPNKRSADRCLDNETFSFPKSGLRKEGRVSIFHPHCQSSFCLSITSVRFFPSDFIFACTCAESLQQAEWVSCLTKISASGKRNWPSNAWAFRSLSDDRKFVPNSKWSVNALVLTVQHGAHVAWSAAKIICLISITSRSKWNLLHFLKKQSQSELNYTWWNKIIFRTKRNRQHCTLKVSQTDLIELLDAHEKFKAFTQGIFISQPGNECPRLSFVPAVSAQERRCNMSAQGLRRATKS